LNDSADINAHTRTDSIRIHRGELDNSGNFLEKDRLIRTEDEPDHDALCAKEQSYFLRAIREDIGLDEHLTAAITSLKIVLAADESMRTGAVVHLNPPISYPGTESR